MTMTDSSGVSGSSGSPKAGVKVVGVDSKPDSLVIGPGGNRKAGGLRGARSARGGLGVRGGSAPGRAPEGVVSSPDLSERDDRSVALAGSTASAAEYRVGRERHRRISGRGALLVTVAILGWAGTIGFGLSWNANRVRAADQAAARNAAQQLVFDLTNFNSRDIDTDFAAIQSMATGPFAQQVRQFFNSTIRSQLQVAQAATRGQIRYLYQQSYGGGQAGFYGLVDQTFANNKTSGPRSDELRLVLDLSKVNGAWKVSNLTELGTPATGGAGAGATSPTGPTGSTGTTGTTAPTG
jgi:hypothetical protein